MLKGNQKKSFIPAETSSLPARQLGSIPFRATAHRCTGAPVHRCSAPNRVRGTGFTLVELLTVIAIIAVLAGILMPALSSAMRKAYEGKARSAISSLEVAISMYETDFGAYPPDGGSPYTNNANMIELLRGAGVVTNNVNWRGPYMEFRQKDLANAVFIDPWDTPYYYRCPGQTNTTSYDIYSYGADAEDDGGISRGGTSPDLYDDINNWE